VTVERRHSELEGEKTWKSRTPRNGLTEKPQDGEILSRAGKESGKSKVKRREKEESECAGGPNKGLEETSGSDGPRKTIKNVALPTIQSLSGGGGNLNEEEKTALSRTEKKKEN